MAGNRFRQIIEVIMKGAGKVASDSKKVQKGLQGVAKDAAKIGAAFYAAKGSINATQNFVSSALKVENLAPAFNKLGAEIGFTSNSMQKLKDATNEKMTSHKIVEVTKRHGITDYERKEIFERLSHYVGETFTTSKYDFANAITNAANSDDMSNERTRYLQELGGLIIFSHNPMQIRI